uniref:Uncharacterized protein n=1 Tax=Micromonas pusilla TaxID=38833 RepID=A0A7S0NIV3_MICPS|mmetsp:Transcript_14482/g.61189  ORF Transcript_14482/g.61189 Transcript_14482/m.61189 type:complete len:249 (+) Transcript_14482:106-852(+)
MAFRNAVSRVGARALAEAGRRVIGLSAEANPSTAVARTFASSAAPRSARNYVEDEIYDRMRQEIPLGNRVPSPGPDAWIAPNAVLIGDTDLAVSVSVWHGAVLKGDLGAVRIGAFTNVGEKVVIDSAGGASRIGQYVTIGANSSISSAIVEDNVVIGARSVLEPGSYVEENAAIEAGTRVEAGALIPSGQLWGGNPARYVRDLDGHEIAEIRSVAEQTYGASQDHAAQSTPWGMAYVQTDALRKALAK